MTILTANQQAVYETLAKARITAHVGEYIAPLLMGGVLDFMFFGIMVAQVCWYFSTAKRDRWMNKITVGVSAVLALATTIFTITYMLHIFVFNFGQYLPIVSFDWINWYGLLNVLTTTVVSINYIERAYSLYGRSKWVIGLTTPLLLSSLAGGLSAKIVAGTKLTDASQATRLAPYLGLWVCSEFVLGLLITGLIARRLVTSKTGWSDTDRMINRLVFICIEAQLPATLVQLAFMISYSIKPNSAVNVFFEMFHPKIYVVGLLLLLNSRGGIRRALHPPSPTTEHTRPAFKSEMSGFRISQYPTEAEFPMDGRHALNVELHDERAALPGMSFDSGGHAAHSYSQWSSGDAETAVGTPMIVDTSFSPKRGIEEV